MAAVSSTATRASAGPGVPAPVRFWRRLRCTHSHPVRSGCACSSTDSSRASTAASCSSKAPAASAVARSSSSNASRDSAASGTRGRRSIARRSSRRSSGDPRAAPAASHDRKAQEYAADGFPARLWWSLRAIAVDSDVSA